MTMEKTVAFHEPKWGLSGNALKILAAFCMVCDHVAVIFEPVLPESLIWLRYLGRLAYPIFAFFIAEGCRYTRDLARYAGTLLFFGLLFHLVYYFATGDATVNVLVSFALGAGMICLWKNFLFSAKKKKPLLSFVALLLFGGYAVLCYYLCESVPVDYAFGGIILPWLVYLTQKRWIRLALFAVGIYAMTFGMGVYADLETWALCAVPVMALYNGDRGVIKMKYFFYVFYPAHVALIYAISLLVIRG